MGGRCVTGVKKMGIAGAWLGTALGPPERLQVGLALAG
jgi:hypothetical protein